jgi:hypothetical protein
MDAFAVATVRAVREFSEADEGDAVAFVRRS